jgi:type I restriction-modification system DNA methylase subunit/predicted type IV restriction endonuclease
MPVPEIVIELMERFARNREAYKSPSYNETQTRREFIDPFFSALGWDVANVKGYAEPYKEVVHEDAVKVSGVTKAPDYSFRVGGVRKFFVEAKKPSVPIKEDATAAYQLRRYAWSAKLPVSILTNFEDFIVYDTRIRPAASDSSSKARILYIPHDHYAEQWEEIASIFAREAILLGAFDRYVESATKKRGTAEVDAAFLEEIEGWRDVLARHLALRNPDLVQRELNFAVQILIDRIVFLRICEDRGIEDYGRLQSLLGGEHVYPRLRELFLQADDRYNSGLFHFHAEKGRPAEPDSLTPRLILDDKVLKDIIRNLYYPESPYEFSVLPADILGQVYERFLGKVIRLTSGHRAVVEEKPEVRKAGGVYYTPTYIVDSIVRNTLGKILEGKTPQEIGGLTSAGHPSPSRRPLAILDPACGSGSFLLGAYQFLLDWHLELYLRDTARWTKGKEPKIYEHRAGGWKLTTSERKRILLANIYGVDIDPQAVEVTKLSLLLKVLEEENAETLRKQLLLFQDRHLPDLDNNIKCGNSLISHDFYTNHQADLFDDDEVRYRINAFDWNSEFHDIMNAGGFDVVIGNPPYGRVSDPSQINYHARSYQCTEGRFDTAELFLEKGAALLKKNGLLGFIIPSPILTNLYSRKLRRYLLDNTSILDITNIGFNVFPDPTVHTCIMILQSARVPGNSIAIRKQVGRPELLNAPYDYSIKQSELPMTDNQVFDIFADPEKRKIIIKMQDRGVPLGDLFFIRQCIKTGNDAEYVRKSHVPLRDPWKPSLRGRGIERYQILEKEVFVKYGPWLARNWQNRSFYERPKIVVRETGNRIHAALDTEHRYLLSSLYSIYPKDDSGDTSLYFYLGILNSALATFFISVIAYDMTQGAFTKIRTNQLKRLPVPTTPLHHPKASSLENKLIAAVKRMMDIREKDQYHKTVHEKTVARRRIAAMDKQMDRLVYELYGLTEDEIRIVEQDMQ